MTRENPEQAQNCDWLLIRLASSRFAKPQLTSLSLPAIMQPPQTSLSSPRMRGTNYNPRPTCPACCTVSTGAKNTPPHDSTSSVFTLPLARNCNCDHTLASRKQRAITLPPLRDLSYFLAPTIPHFPPSPSIPSFRVPLPSLIARRSALRDVHPEPVPYPRFLQLSYMSENDESRKGCSPLPPPPPAATPPAHSLLPESV